MTKSTITRERLEKIKSWRETYGTGSNVMLPAEEAEELACLVLAAIDSKPFAYIIQDKYERERGVEGHLSRSHVSKYVSQEDINDHEITCTPLYRHAQPALVSLTEAQVAALEEEEKSFHDAIRKCIASLRYHHKRAEAHSTGYKGSTLEDDTLKSINFLKRNITTAMLNGGKP
jgi:hypothetical protein|nr:MAG TPA: hypothetical protein [Caudoviricetes sp.]